MAARLRCTRPLSLTLPLPHKPLTTNHSPLATTPDPDPEPDPGQVFGTYLYGVASPQDGTYMTHRSQRGNAPQWGLGNHLNPNLPDPNDPKPGPEGGHAKPVPAWPHALDTRRARQARQAAALSARVARAAPNKAIAHSMRATVLGALAFGAWEAGPRSAAELTEAAAHFERSAALSYAPAVKAEKIRLAGLCRSEAVGM